MNVELTYLIAIINVVLAIAVFYFARKKDTSDTAFRSAEIVSELKTVRRDLSEMKMDVQAMRKEWRDDHDALQRVIHEMAAVWRVVDGLKERSKKDERQN